MVDSDRMLLVDSHTHHTDFPKVHNLKASKPAFTPINCNPSRTVRPQETLWHKDLSDISLFDLDGVEGQDGVIQNRKRERSQTVNGRSMPFTPVWRYEDNDEKDDMHIIDDDPLKKREAAPKNRSKSSNSRIINPARAKEEQRAPPSMPTASRKRSKDGSSAVKRKTNQNPNPVFKNPVITKPSSRSCSKNTAENETRQEDDSLIRYQGFVTSQESVQPSSGVPARTTMEKLAAFRYAPSSIKSKEAAKEWWITSGRPINESPFKTPESGIEAIHKHPAMSVDVDIDLLDTLKDTLPVLQIDQSPDSFTSDEYDEGLNDDDFLAIEAEVVDEYPVDESDEEELLQLVALKNTAINVPLHVPPSSVQHAFGDEGEVYDSSLQFSPPNHQKSVLGPTNSRSANQSPINFSEMEPLRGEEEDWSFMSANYCTENHNVAILDDFSTPSSHLIVPKPPNFKLLNYFPRENSVANCPLSGPQSVFVGSKIHTSVTHITDRRSLDDGHEYAPLEPFVRPPFPSLIIDRCPIDGLSSQCFLRTCFRVGEMYQAGSQCNAEKLDAVIELFARVNFSSREIGTTKQHFQFMDLWHDRGPYPNGILESCKTTRLAENESSVFLSGVDKKMARVLGRLKRDVKKACWFMQIINIRMTDWEEIRWTKRIMTGDDIAKKIFLGGI